jgi:hypothetical protein
MYRCNDQQCPNREKQSFFCGKCLPINHKHFPLLISNEIDELEKMWQDLKNNVTNTFKAVESLYKKYKPIIEYLEHSMMMPQVVVPP